MNGLEHRNEELVDRAARALREMPVPGGPPPEVLAAVVAAGRAVESDIQTVDLQQRRRLTRRVAKIAAVLLVAAGIITALVLTFERSPRIAFAQAQETIQRTETMTCRIRMTRPAAENMPQEIDSRGFFSGRDRMRIEGLNGAFKNTIVIFDLQQGKMLTLCDTPESGRIAVVVDIGQAPEGQVDDQCPDLLQRLKDLVQAGGKPLGEKEIGGRKAVGFAAASGGQTGEIWVGAEKGQEILLVEVDIPGKGHFQLSELVINPQLDPALFSIEPPAGYRLVSMPAAQLGKAAERPGVSGPTGVSLAGVVPFAGKFLQCLAVSPDGQVLALGGPADNKQSLVILWDTQARKETLRIKIDVRNLSGLSFAADSRSLLAIPGDAPAIFICDTKTGQVKHTLRSGTEAKISGAVFSKDADRVATVCSDGKLRVFEVASGTLVKTVALPDLGQVIVSNPKKSLFAMTAGLKISIWDFETVTLHSEIDLPSAEARPYSLAYSPDGSLLAAGRLDGKVQMWDVASGSLRYEWPHQAGFWAVFCVQFSPDSTLLAARAGQLTEKKDFASAWAMLKAGSPTRLWNLKTGKVLTDLEGSWVCPVFTAGYTLSFMPDSQTLAITDSPDVGARLYHWQASTAAGEPKENQP